MSNASDHIISLMLICLPIMPWLISSRGVQNGWLHPRRFFSVVWLFYCVLPIIALFDVPIDPMGVLWISVCILAFNLGSITFDLSISLRPKSTERRVVKRAFSEEASRLLRNLTLLCLVLGFCSGIVLLLHGIHSFSSSLSAQTFMADARYYSVERYSVTGYREPILSTFFSIFIYAGAGAGGVLYASTDGRRLRLLALFPCLPALFVTTILTTRATLLFTGASWVACYCATSAFLGKDTLSHLNFRLITTVFLAVALFFPLYAFFQSMREGLVPSVAFFENMIGSLAASVLGYLPAFSTWFSSYWAHSTPLQWGAYTFCWIYRILGLHPFMVKHLSIPVGSSFTNIYTFFRGTVEDFGLCGTIVIFFLYGVFFSFVFFKVIRGKLLYGPLLGIFYAYTLCSLVGNMFSYTVIIGCWILVYMLFIYLHRLRAVRNILTKKTTSRISRILAGVTTAARVG